MKETVKKTPIENPKDTEAEVSKTFSIADIKKKLDGKGGKAYWRSLDELADTPEFHEFLHKEFPRQAAPLESSINRREFMKLLGASLALGGLTSCALPPEGEKLLPYVEQPEELVPGKPLFFATALNHSGYAMGALVESYEGRPIKVEGNPEHPASLGASDIFMQASVLTLYDPDRSQVVVSQGQGSSYEEAVVALEVILEDLEEGEGFRLLTEVITSPTLAAQIEALLERYPGARWHQWDPTYSENVTQGAELAFGEALRPLYRFDEAEVILSLGADFLGSGPGKLHYTRDFSRARRVLSAEDEMNRLYVAESTPSLTGAMADHRLPLRPAELEALARVVARELGVEAGTGDIPTEGLPEEWVAAVVEDLRDAAGRSVVVAGDEQSAAVHALAHAINGALGNLGTTVALIEPVEASVAGDAGSLAELVEDIAAGDVQALVMIGGNPVYTAPADLDFAAALAAVPFSLHHSLYYDETSAVATWHVPHTHELETWSDARAFDGTATIMQPLIAFPFYQGRSPHQLLAALSGDLESSPYDLVRAYWQERLGDDFESAWRTALYRGVVEGTAALVREVSVSLSLPEEAFRASDDTLHILFRPDPNIYADHYANNGWLQELPKPFTKLTWDNAALVSPETAVRYGVSNGDVVELSLGGHSVPAPIWILPGQADGVVTAHLGYGRVTAGHLGTGQGFNAYQIRTSLTPWVGGEAEMTPTGAFYPLVSTQMHHALEEDRHIVRHGTLEEFQAHPEHPEFVHPAEHHEADLYRDYEYLTYAWGMVVDMNVCTGCNACVIACQAENNIPIVGKEQVAVGREMHWIRVDSYYAGDIDNPDYYFQPMLCQHCEKAPCEPVCPVAATVHDHEGLNVMVYNRCVGTRYCSNNCPYKVRRFNFLQYAELEETALSMLYNPNVTVRSRGVMEKCTYCVQRLNSARIQAEIENRRIVDGEVVTACQAACPAEAIIFGDINSQDSRVTQTKASPLNYAVLEELNTVPRTSYITKLRNPHPALVSLEEVH